MAWIIINDRQNKSKEKESDQDYLMWITNPSLWQSIHESSKVPDDEFNSIPIAVDELGAVEKFLQSLDKPKEVSNKDLNKWTDWQ